MSAEGQPPVGASPIGRYEEVAAAERTVTVRLLGVPLHLFLSAREQHDELIREFAVMALAHRDEDPALPAELRTLVRELGSHYAASSQRRPADDIDEAVTAGAPTVDLTYDVSPAVLAGADRLEAWLATADEFCRAGLMLTMPRSPASQRFAAWWLGELRRQYDGHAPTPWPPPATDGEATPVRP